jgi:hypothetical protein
LPGPINAHGVRIPLFGELSIDSLEISHDVCGTSIIRWCPVGIIVYSEIDRCAVRLAHRSGLTDSLSRLGLSCRPIEVLRGVVAMLENGENPKPSVVDLGHFRRLEISQVTPDEANVFREVAGECCRAQP